MLGAATVLVSGAARWKCLSRSPIYLTPNVLEGSFEYATVARFPAVS
jgi:hypothetical protein